MKILFVNPPSKKGIMSPLLGFGYIASVVEQYGHKVKILDCLALNLNSTDLEKEIKKYDPDVLGVSSITQQMYYTYSVFEIAKRINPNCLTVIGGTHPSVLSKETLQECSFLDVVVRGEGEITFIELIEKFDKGIGFEGVLGITFRRGDGVVFNADRPLIQDLDSLPFPAYHLLPMDYYNDQVKFYNLVFNKKKSSRLGTISTSRGCPYNCIFCSSRALMGKKYRVRSAENVIEELKILREKYRIRSIDFLDDTFTFNKKRVEAICKLIKKEDIDISWFCGTRVDVFDKEIAKLLKIGGCEKIFFGLESGNNETLNYLCKGMTIDDSLRAVKNAKEEGLKILSNFSSVFV